MIIVIFTTIGVERCITNFVAVTPLYCTSTAITASS